MLAALCALSAALLHWRAGDGCASTSSYNIVMAAKLYGGFGAAQAHRRRAENPGDAEVIGGMRMAADGAPWRHSALAAVFCCSAYVWRAVGRLRRWRVGRLCRGRLFAIGDDGRCRSAGERCDVMG